MTGGHMHRVMAKNKWDQMRNRYSGPWGPNPWINSASVGPPPRPVDVELRPAMASAPIPADGERYSSGDCTEALATR